MGSDFDEDHRENEHPPEEADPKEDACQTKPFINGYSECLTNRPYCRHAISFGFVYLCKNPKHLEFYLRQLKDKKDHS